MANRLANATSPYLLQHADNPVDWWEWGPEAFAEAKRRDTPILLSVGYAACHWCHVMAHESFEDEATAAYLNEHFVSIKVDREERPDVDAVYMQATTAMTGHGGWPMTCVLDHDGNPFFAGTYFPDQPRHGQPRSGRCSRRSSSLARTHDEVRRVAANAARPPQPAARRRGGRSAPRGAGRGRRRWRASFDPQRGGFGGAPKFPPSMVLEFLLRHGSEPRRDGRARPWRRWRAGGSTTSSAAASPATASTRDWVVPHFEKMLYDNALLLRVYARWGTDLGAGRGGDRRLPAGRAPHGRRWLRLRAGRRHRGRRGHLLRLDPGSSSTDVLGPDDGAVGGRCWRHRGGTFEHGASTLQLREDPDDVERWPTAAAVAGRPRRAGAAGRDDKVVAAWNGLAISGCAPRAPCWPAGVRRRGGRGRRPAGGPAPGGRAAPPGVTRRRRRPPRGVLEDHGCVAAGFLSCSRRPATPLAGSRRAAARRGAGRVSRADDGGFFDTADDAEALVARPRDPSDNASPSGLSSTVHALLDLRRADRVGSHRDAAEAALASRRGARRAGAALRRLVAGRGAVDARRAATRSRSSARPARAGRARAARRPAAGRGRGRRGRAARRRPAAVGRAPVDGRPAAYVCRGLVCERPVTDLAAL